MVNWNKFILTHKFESSFSQFIWLSNCTFWILSSPRRYPKCTLWNYQWYGQTPEVSRVLLQDFTKTSTNSESCSTTSYTQPVRLRKFWNATSSTGDGSQGGIPTGWQLIIFRSEWWKHIIILPFLPLMQTWTYRTCDQPLLGVVHVSSAPTPSSSWEQFHFPPIWFTLVHNNSVILLILKWTQGKF